MWFTGSSKLSLPDPANALPGRAEAVEVPERHFVNGAKLIPPYPAGSQVAHVAMGCFWGAEKLFWEKPGVIVTAVGYAGGPTPNPTYRENHNPTQGMRQGNDTGTQYRSAIYTADNAQRRIAEASRDAYQPRLAT